MGVCFDSGRVIDRSQVNIIRRTSSASQFTCSISTVRMSDTAASSLHSVHIDAGIWLGQDLSRMLYRRTYITATDTINRHRVTRTQVQQLVRIDLLSYYYSLDFGLVPEAALDGRGGHLARGGVLPRCVEVWNQFKCEISDTFRHQLYQSTDRPSTRTTH